MSALSGQMAVVTGAGSGIGRAIALRLAELGAGLRLVGRQSKNLEAAAEAARARGAAAQACVADLAQPEAIRQLAAELRTLERLDVLVHSAGVFTQGPLASAPAEDLDRNYAVNVRAPYLLTQLLLPGLRQSRGQIVFINSTAGLAARAQVSAYAASKHALKALADSLRDEVNADGLRVLSVFPGRTASPLQASVHALEGRAYHPELLMQPEDVAEMVVGALQLPRTAEVTDLHVRPARKPPAA
jgi:short-subunit dehydrogenase